MKQPVSKDHLAYIGDMTVSFALLETAIKCVVWTLIGESGRIGNIVTAELYFKNLRSLAISLYLERYGEDSDFQTLKTLMKEADNIEERRNQFTHSIWAVGKDPESLTRIKPSSRGKEGLRFQIEDVQSDELAKFVIRIQKLSDEIQVFWKSLLVRGKAGRKDITNMDQVGI